MRAALLIAGAGLGVAALALVVRQAQAVEVVQPYAEAPDVGIGAWFGALADAGAQVAESVGVLDTSQGMAEVLQVNPEGNVRAFLAMIRKAEGAGYDTLFGGGAFQGYADHPRVKTWEKRDEFIANGKKDYTTAAGAYQITATTWDRVAPALKLPDFSPQSQDLCAIELIRRRGALADVRAGRFDVAVGKCAAEWASLPGGPYPQPTRSAAFVRAAIEQAGGMYA